MWRYETTYVKRGKQVPVSVPPNVGPWLRFGMEGADHAVLQVSYDPPVVPLKYHQWLTFEGGSLGYLAGPPTAVRVILREGKHLKSNKNTNHPAALQPLCFWIESWAEENEGEETLCRIS